MIRRIVLGLFISLTASTAWAAVALIGGNGKDWTVGQYTDDQTHKIQCLMRWDDAGRTFTYAIFKDGAVMSFRRNDWSLPETMTDTSISLGGKPVTVQRLDDHTLGLGWGDAPSPLATILFNSFIQSGDEMTVSFQMDESPWIIPFPVSSSVSDGWVKCLAKLDEN